MPGLLGIVSGRGDEDLPERLEQMVRPLQRHPWQRVERSIWDRAAFAAVSVKETSSFCERDGRLLGLYGEIYDQESLREKLRGKREPAGEPAFPEEGLRAELPEVLLRLYEREGPSAFTGLNGLYVILVWDENIRRLTLINDRLGMGRVVYWQAEGRFLFAPEVKCLASHPRFERKLDLAGMFDLVAIGHYLGERTLFTEAHVLPAAQIAIFQDGELSLEGYWCLEVHAGLGKVSRERELIEELDFRLTEAVRRRYTPDAVLLLTGGLDSRMLAGIMGKLDPSLRVKTLTAGSPGCDEVTYAQEISRTLGLEHQLIPLPPDFLEAFAAEWAWNLEGNMSCHASWIYALHPWLEQNRPPYLLTGVAGDAATGRLKIEAIDRAASVDEAIQALYHRPEWQYEKAFKLFRPEIAQTAGAASFATLEESFRDALADDSKCRFDCILFSQLLRRYVTGGDSLGDYTTVIEPYFDNDLFDFLLHLPREQRNQGRLFKSLILQRYSHLGQAGYTKTHRPLRHSLRRELSGNGLHRMAYRIWDGIERRTRLLSRAPRRANPGRCVDQDGWLRGPSRKFVQETLHKKEYLEDLFNLDQIEQILDEQMNRGGKNFKLVTALVTVSLLRQKFG